MPTAAEGLRWWSRTLRHEVEYAEVEVAVGDRIRVIRAQYLGDREVGIARCDVALAGCVVGAESAQKCCRLMCTLRGTLGEPGLGVRRSRRIEE